MVVYSKTSLAMIAIVAILAVVTTSTVIATTTTIMQPAHALTRFFNCTTTVANKTHQLNLQDVNACYNKEFHSAGDHGTGTITKTGSGERKALTQHHHDITEVTPIT